MLPSFHDIPVIEFEIVKVEDRLSEGLPFQVCKICILGERQKKDRQFLPETINCNYSKLISVCDCKTFSKSFQ